jgi:hypothetical protein
MKGAASTVPAAGGGFWVPAGSGVVVPHWGAVAAAPVPVPEGLPVDPAPPGHAVVGPDGDVVPCCGSVPGFWPAAEPSVDDGSCDVPLGGVAGPPGAEGSDPEPPVVPPAPSDGAGQSGDGTVPVPGSVLGPGPVLVPGTVLVPAAVE